MRIRIALATTVLAATAVIGTAGAAVATDPKPPTGPVGVTGNSPGVLSGDVIQIPIHVPVNVCGDSIDVIGLLNPASGNTCTNN